LAGHWSVRYSVPTGMALGVGCLLGGTLLTLSLQLWVIIAGLLINSIGFFLLHSLASAWVGKHAGEGRAMASALYLMFYYFGSAAGGFYLLYWWGSGNWPAVVAAAVAALLLIPGLLYALRRRNLPSDLDSSRQHC
ncbi:MAG: MFS transporter, partial [Plesiomonas shigelloides]